MKDESKGYVTCANNPGPKWHVIDQPELLQSDPYGAGWLLELEATDAAQLAALMDADAYGAKVEGSSK